MARHLFALAAVLCAAGLAPAQYPVYCPPAYYPPMPVVVCCPPVACVCPPAVGVVGSATPKATGEQKTPRIVPERMPEKDQPKKETKAEPPAAPREFATPKPAEPTADPKSDVKSDVTPAGGNVPSIPIPAPAVPMTPAPKPKDPEPPAAKPKDPEPTAAKPSLPAFEFAPPAELPKAKDTVPPLPIPPAKSDTPKAEEKAKIPESLPAFDIDFPKTAPAQPVEANKPVVARSSPLSGGGREVTVDVYPVDGPAPASPTAKRTIGFINKSDRDLLLTIDGKMVTLPSKNVLRAELPAAVRWQVGGGEERDLKVPPTAPGVDVVIRK